MSPFWEELQYKIDGELNPPIADLLAKILCNSVMLGRCQSEYITPPDVTV
jgi:hypothetical protein